MGSPMCRDQQYHPTWDPKVSNLATLRGRSNEYRQPYQWKLLFETQLPDM